MDNSFVQDVTRISLFLNEQEIDTSQPKKVWDTILNLVNGDVDVMKAIVYYLKQECLVNMYIDEATMIETNESLICQQDHTVVLNVKNGKLWFVEVIRSFKLCFLSDIGEMWDMDIIKFKLKRHSNFSEDVTEVRRASQDLLPCMGKSDVLTSSSFDAF